MNHLRRNNNRRSIDEEPIHPSQPQFSINSNEETAGFDRQDVPLIEGKPKLRGDDLNQSTLIYPRFPSALIFLPLCTISN